MEIKFKYYVWNLLEYYNDEHSMEKTLYYHIVNMLPDYPINIDTLVLTFRIALQDMYRQKQKNDDNDFSSDSERISIFPYTLRCPDFVRFVAKRMLRKEDAIEFSDEFRRKYYQKVLGVSLPELPDVDYGYNETSLEVVDISDKDMFEVLAALYNHAAPIGKGFEQYNPIPWTKEIAKEYYGAECLKKGKNEVFLDYILGRPIKIQFGGPTIMVEEYNEINGAVNLAQRVIAACPNITMARKRESKEKST